MAITASMVKELREMTGAGMMDCKKALSETNGDMDAAIEFLRKNGEAKAVKKAGRNIIDAGVISGIDMTPETTYVKLCWALGQSDDYSEVKEIMHKNIAGEFSKKSSIKDFLN